jgi:hypothetical protein
MQPCNNNVQEKSYILKSFVLLFSYRTKTALLCVLRGEFLNLTLQFHQYFRCLRGLGNTKFGQYAFISQ